MRAIPLLGALALVLASREAAAGDDLRLSWRAPEGCPSEAHVREATLRAAPEGGAREPLDAEVSVDHGERWTVTIRAARAGVVAAERHLDASSCQTLADATAVILAMALVPSQPERPEQPDETGEPPPRQPAGPGLSGAAPSLTSAAAADTAEPRASRPGPYAHALAASGAAVTDGTTLPSPALGGRVALAWTPRRARLELGGSIFSGQSKTTGTSPAGAAFTLLVAGGRGCWAVARGALEISPCAGADVQVVQARGYGASSNYDASAAWISVAGGALVRLPITGWLALRGDADAVVPLARPRFVVLGDGAVHRPEAFGVRAGIGAELLFF